MNEPYRTLWAWAGAANFPQRVWLYDVKWTGSAFYIGDDDEHITILEDTDGFHHSFNERGRHVTRGQHDATDLDDICSHIRFNRRAYFNGRDIIRALEYIRDNAPGF